MDNENGKLVYAMLDTGSDRDVISEELIADLELEQRIKSVTVQTVEATITEDRNFVDVRIQSIDGSYNAEITDALVGKLVAGKTDIPPAKRNLSALRHVENIEFDNIDAGILMIIGLSHIEA